MVMVTNIAGDMVIDFFKSVPYPLLHGNLPSAHQLLPEETEVTAEGMRTLRQGHQTKSYIVPNYTWWPGEGMTEGDNQAPVPAHRCSWSELWVTSRPAQGPLTLNANSNPQRWGRFCCWHLHTDPGHAQTQSRASGEKATTLSSPQGINCDPHLWTVSPFRNNYAWNIFLLFWRFSLVTFIKECVLSGKIPGWKVLIVPQVVLCGCFCCL